MNIFWTSGSNIHFEKMFEAFVEATRALAVMVAKGSLKASSTS
jgi:hypothetical protein